MSDVLSRVGDKWSVMIVGRLGDQTLRFSEIRRSIGTISQRMLTLTLRNLERDGLVTRTVYPEVPPRVEYALTPLGQSLRKPISALWDWSVDHYEDITAARADYDADQDEAAKPIRRPYAGREAQG
jgi:DNA-binding HxlR family transcriptional regulator